MARLSRIHTLLVAALTGAGAVMSLASCASFGATQHGASLRKPVDGDPSETVAITPQMLAEMMSWASVDYVAEKNGYRVFTHGPNSPAFHVPRHYERGESPFETDDNGFLSHVIIPSLEQFRFIPVGQLDPLNSDYEPDLGAAVLARTIASPGMQYFKTPEGNMYGKAIPDSSIRLITTIDAPYLLSSYLTQLKEGRSIDYVKGELRADLTGQAMGWLAEPNANIWTYSKITQAMKDDVDVYAWVVVPYDDGSLVQGTMMQFRVFGFGVTDPRIDAPK